MWQKGLHVSAPRIDKFVRLCIYHEIWQTMCRYIGDISATDLSRQVCSLHDFSDDIVTCDA